MKISLHKMARTTPAIRAEIAHGSDTITALARRFDITEMTVRKWRSRDTFEDRSHTAHHLQTVTTPAQEVIAVHPRRTLLLPLDDLLAVMKEFVW